MGIVRRQSTLNLVWSYVGVLLGYVNKIILYTEILSRAQFGLLELLLTFMTIGTEVCLLGTPKIITRFFPIFRGHPTREGRMMFFITAYSLLGFLMLVAGLLLTKPLLVEAYQANSPLFADSFHYVLPITFGYLSYRVLAGISGSLFRSVTPMLAFEVVLKVLLAGLIFVYFQDWISFDQLVLIYVLMHFIPALIILVDIWSNKLRWTIDWTVFRSRLGRIMIRYGVFSSLSDATSILVQRLDIVLVGYFLGEIEAGTYAIGIYFSSLIAKPSRSMTAILAPLMATRLKERNLDEVNQLYQKTVINNTLVGGFLWVMLLINIWPFFDLFPKHSDAIPVALVLGMSLFFGMAAGPNRLIILNSHLYRFDFYANFMALILAFALDLWLIPLYGLVGAAIATLIIKLAFNLANMLYVKRHYQLFPFNRQVIGAFVVLSVLGALCMLIPPVIHPIITMGIRSATAGLLFAIYLFWARPSKELNELMMMGIRKVWRRNF